MNADRDDLSVRKDLLVAQSALYRAQLRGEMVTLQARVSRGATIMAVAKMAFSAVSLVRRIL